MGMINKGSTRKSNSEILRTAGIQCICVDKVQCTIEHGHHMDGFARLGFAHRLLVEFPRVKIMCRPYTPKKSIGCDYKPKSPNPLLYTHAKRSRTHVKNPVVHVRVRWIKETIKHPACTLGWVAQLCRS